MRNKKMSENGLSARGLLWRSFVELHWKKVVAVGCLLVIALVAQILGQKYVDQPCLIAWFHGLLELLVLTYGAVFFLAVLYLSWRVVTVNIEIMRIRRFFPLEYKWLNEAGIKTYQDCILFLWVIGQPRLDLGAKGRPRVFISRDEQWVSPLLRLFHDFP